MLSSGRQPKKGWQKNMFTFFGGKTANNSANEKGCRGSKTERQENLGKNGTPPHRKPLTLNPPHNALGKDASPPLSRVQASVPPGCSNLEASIVQTEVSGKGRRMGQIWPRSNPIVAARAQDLERRHMRVGAEVAVLDVPLAVS
ncbi:hypothetical protein B0H16DRAFT_1465636 [Mycena metata]|uniref:Uncharacterized protein n=1 Tax=Mycena metata TaxID=1033252 RepID=A0AAD7IBY6_9AGAR|nr:hypothetical protein B0H16DRAFT_1465636 [Mycena metata]